MTEAWPEVAPVGHNNGSLSASEVTVGQWATEADSASALDAILDQLGLWTVHKEVEGKLMQPRAGQANQDVRIDRVLVPRKNLIDCGWRHGIIGIEVKRSGVKVGPPIAQALDYGRSAWRLPAGFTVWLDFVFIWPMGGYHGTLASILEQNRIGSAYSTDWDRLYLRSGQANVISVRRNGEIRIGAAQGGRKVGSR